MYKNKINYHNRFLTGRQETWEAATPWERVLPAAKVRQRRPAEKKTVYEKPKLETPNWRWHIKSKIDFCNKAIGIWENRFPHYDDHRSPYPVRGELEDVDFELLHENLVVEGDDRVVHTVVDQNALVHLQRHRSCMPMAVMPISRSKLQAIDTIAEV